MHLDPQRSGPVTILSDLHIGHALSVVRHPRQLRPLLDAGGTVIFNGDTIEQRMPGQAARSAVFIEALRAEAAAAGCEPVFIAGNHDPFLCERRAALICGGKVLVTHGHALFENATPWSNRAAAMTNRARELAQLEGGPADPLPGLTGLDRRLAVANLLSIETDVGDIPREAPLWAKLGHYLSEFLHPERPFLVLKCWAETPRVAAAFAEQFTPGARFVVIGHTHLPGAWHAGGRVVINTGSFSLPLWRSGVRIENGWVTVAAIRRRGGLFRFGKTLRRFPLDDPLNRLAAAFGGGENAKGPAQRV